MAIIFDMTTFILLAIIIYMMGRYIWKKETEENDILTSDFAKKILDEEKDGR